MPAGVFLAGEILYLFVTSLALNIVMIAVSIFGYHLSLPAHAYVAIFCYTVLGCSASLPWARAHEGDHHLGDGRLGSDRSRSSSELRQRRLFGAQPAPQWLLNFSTYLPLERS